MKLHQPTALKALLQELKIHPRRSLSQNFLIDGNIIRKIVDAAKIEKKDQILEIGPGPGVLTEALLEKGALVTAIEKDNQLFHALTKWNHPSLTLINQDFLKTDLPSILKPKTKVVANIPYSITGILLQKLLPMGNEIESLTLMVQKEVAQRLIAKKGTPHYSSFTLYTSYYSTPQLLFTVEPTSFYPKPKVTSALIQLKLKKTDPHAPNPLKLIRAAFQKRRKMLRASLKSLFPPNQIEIALQQINHPKTTRPQELSLNEFQTLHTLLHTFN